MIRRGEPGPMKAVTKILTCLGVTSILIVGTPAIGQIYFGKAVAIDGDTIELGGQRIRLFGIDAVEAAQSCERSGETWTCGQDAASALSAIVEGRNLQCETRDVDRYGRVVAICTRDGRDIGRAMVQMGLAVALPEFSRDYVMDEEAARARRAGIWAGTFQAPKDFRASDSATAENERALLAQQKARREANDAQAARSYATQARSNVYYRNCKEARAAGVTPLYRGQPGYGEHMDGDGDGVACEPYRGRR